MGGSNATSSSIATTFGRITTGNVAVGAQAAWATTGLGADIPAAVGDTVSFVMGPLMEWAVPASDYFDVVVVGAGPAIVRRSSTGTANPTGSDHGDPGLYPTPSQYFSIFTPFSFVVAATDLVGGNIQFRLYSKGAGGSTVYASADYPLRYWATVHS